MLAAAPLLAAYVVPKVQAHLSAFSWPVESYQALRFGSVPDSSSSCAMTEAIPSTPVVPSPKSESLVDVGGGQHKIDPVRVGGQLLARQGCRHDGCDIGVSETGRARVVVGRAAAEAHGVGYVSARSVEVRCVDIEVWRSANVLRQVGQNAYRARVPGSVPDVIDIGRAQHDRATVIIDPVARGSGSTSRRRRQHIAGAISFTIRDVILALSLSIRASRRDHGSNQQN